MARAMLPPATGTLWQLVACVRRRRHVLAMALAIPLCVLVVGVIVVIVMVLRRQLARVHQKNLQLTAKITGVVECEVKLLTYCFFSKFRRHFSPHRRTQSSARFSSVHLNTLLFGCYVLELTFSTD